MAAVGGTLSRAGNYDYGRPTILKHPLANGGSSKSERPSAAALNKRRVTLTVNDEVIDLNDEETIKDDINLFSNWSRWWLTLVLWSAFKIALFVVVPYVFIDTAVFTDDDYKVSQTILLMIAISLLATDLVLLARQDNQDFSFTSPETLKTVCVLMTIVSFAASGMQAMFAVICVSRPNCPHMVLMTYSSTLFFCFAANYAGTIHAYSKLAAAHRRQYSVAYSALAQLRTTIAPVAGNVLQA